ncbi:MAG: hypothetical protein ACNA7Q_01270 [Rhodobacterales bacterium]
MAWHAGLDFAVKNGMAAIRRCDTKKTREILLAPWTIHSIFRRSIEFRVGHGTPERICALRPI